MKKVLILVPWLVGHGQERMAALTANLLKDLYDVEIVVFDDSKIEYETSAKITSLGAPPKDSTIGKIIQVFRRVYRMNKYRKQCSAYAVVSFGTSANLCNALSRRACGKTIISFRGYESVTKDIVNTLCCKYADSIFCISKQMCRDFSELYREYSAKFLCCYNGIDINDVCFKSKQNSNFIPISHPAFVSVGRLEHVKGYTQLLRSFSKVVEKCQTASLTIIGEGSLHAELVELCHNLGIADKVTFLGKKENPFQYLKECDICVQTSIHEGFMNVIVEAGACGLPVISTDCKAGPREILCSSEERQINSVEYSDYGILVPSFLSDALVECEKEDYLAEAMITLANDSTLQRDYANRLKERIEFFSSDRYKENIIQIIETT